MGKQFFLRSAFVVAATLLAGCNEGTNTTSDCCNTVPTYNDDFTFASSGLFPFQNNSNWWKYSAPGGHSFAINILDTITDNHVTYFKVSFGEKGVDTTNNWFRKSSLGTEYSTSLSGAYLILLPTIFNGRQGTFSSTSNEVTTYSYLDSLQVNGKYRKKVMSLNFSNRNIHGFDEIDFADGLGVVRMIDSSGRFPLTYSLDSARINGIVYK